MEAIRLYAEALHICNPEFVLKCPDELLKPFVELGNNLLNNLSLCYFNIQQYEHSITMAKEVRL